MATTVGPLFSLDASGTVGGAIVFSKWKGRNYVRRWARPANPQSAGQLSVRAMMKFLSQYWVNLSASEQADWETRAAVTNISPFNAYVSYNMARWGTFLFPSQQDPATEADSAGIAANLAATASSRSILIDVDITTLNDNWGIAIYRRLTTGLSADRNLLVQILPATSVASFSWLDTPLAVGVEQFYVAHSLSEDGVVAADLAEVSATPTA